MFEILSVWFTIEYLGNKCIPDLGSNFGYRVFARENRLEADRDVGFGKWANIWDGNSSREFYTLNNFENWTAIRPCTRNVRCLRLQLFMFGLISNSRFQCSGNNESFLQLYVFKNKLKAILIPSDVLFFKPYNKSQRTKVAYTALWPGYVDRESL